MLSSSTELRDKLAENTRYFRAGMGQLGFNIVPGEHPIVPIMIGDAVLAGRMAERLLAHGVYVIGFSYPVVPLGKARIRVQVSAAHSRADLDRAMLVRYIEWLNAQRCADGRIWALTTQAAVYGALR